ncbi:MAG: hypothetical protein ACTSQA_04800, partial [Candidatus Heimdallarchaeaceae archaeon]
KMRSPIGVWTTTVVLTTLSTQYVDFPDLEIDSNDNIHVVYEDNTDMLGAGGDEDIFYLWFNKSLSLWSTAYLVSTECTSDSRSAGIAVDPISGDPFIVWNDGTDILSAGTDSDIFSKSYDHSSSSFSSLMLITTESNGQSYNPDIDFNSKGVPHVFWYDYYNLLGSGGDGDIFYKYLNTITHEWIGFELVSSESNGGSTAPQCIIDKEDRIYVIWDDYADILGAGTDLDCFFKFKDPSSSSWSEMKLISSESTNYVSSANIAVDSKGFVSCIWTDYDNLIVSDSDYDVYYKKFVGTPNTPILLAISPNLSTDANVSLNWENSPFVSSYSLYRSTSPFTSTSLGSMSPIATLSSNSFNDTLNDTGLFYYGVVAHNEYGDSGLSNVEYVQFVEDVSGTFFGFLSSIGILEILTIVGVIILSQVLISLLISSIVKGGNKGSKGKSKGKKKK